MMLWFISCVNKPNTGAKRDELRPEHSAYLTRRKDVLVLSGPTQSDDGSELTGSVFIINANSRAEAKAFSDNDPFTQAGLYSSVTITRMRKGQWNPEVGDRA
jgi:uncharacterized protein YciI